MLVRRFPVQPLQLQISDACPTALIGRFLALGLYAVFLPPMSSVWETQADEMAATILYRLFETQVPVLAVRADFINEQQNVSRIFTFLPESHNM